MPQPIASADVEHSVFDGRFGKATGSWLTDRLNALPKSVEFGDRQRRLLDHLERHIANSRKAADIIGMMIESGPQWLLFQEP